MRVKFRTRRKVRAALDMTPFMDLSVQLVIFFMLTSTFTTSAALDVDLPSASTAAAVKESDEIRVTVDRQDNVTVDKRKLAFAELERYFRDGAARSPKPEVLIGADRYASHGTVVRVMDTARRAGLDRFSIAAARDMAGAEAPETASAAGGAARPAAPGKAPAPGKGAPRKDGKKHATL